MSQSPPPPAAAECPGGLQEIFQGHHGSVLRAAYRITGNSTDAEDVLQTVFMRLARRPADAPPMDNIGAYLHRAAVNAALDLVRDRREGQHVPLETQAPLLAAPVPAPDSQMEAREIQDFIRLAVARLAPRAAEVFALHYFEGYSNSEIAGMLEISASGVGVTLHRARTRLQEEIKSFLGEPL
jgi:RNA polymerase sigma-70 factor, ECF subfamily